MSQRTCLSVILAAGEGTRMKSTRPKVMHEVAGLPMVSHVARATLAAGGTGIAVVAGNGAEQVVAEVRRHVPDAGIYIQAERLGTAHAALAASEAIARGYDDVLVLFGDTPLVDVRSIATARAHLANGAAVVVFAFRANDPSGYGRLIERGGRLVAIREDRDCSPQEREITLCNGGLMAIDGARALTLMEAVGNANAKNEFYLTDIVGIAHEEGLEVSYVEVPYHSVLGVNNRVELASAEAIWQAGRREAMMLSGVTMIVPESVHLSWDTVIGADTVVEADVWFGPGVTVEPGATIRSFSHLEGTTVRAGAEIGPFARLRPGADIGIKAKVGNFCEVKAATVAEGAKVNHLTYIGDASIGAGANIGAGTITCNYDGFSKHHTTIGPGAFIGSNSALIAPVSIGAGAYVASGSVISADVPQDALAFGRARQRTIEERGRTLRERLAAAKAARKA